MMSFENPKMVRIIEILKRRDSELCAQLDASTFRIAALPYARRRAIADVLMDEFLRAGMTPEHDENDYGREIEALVDALELHKRSDV